MFEKWTKFYLHILRRWKRVVGSLTYLPGKTEMTEPPLCAWEGPRSRFNTFIWIQVVVHQLTYINISVLLSFICTLVWWVLVGWTSTGLLPIPQWIGKYLFITFYILFINQLNDYSCIDTVRNNSNKGTVSQQYPKSGNDISFKKSWSSDIATCNRDFANSKALYFPLIS